MKLDLGISLHDSDLRKIALAINFEDSLIDGFKASHRWLQGFKRRCGIASRRVTTFISRRTFSNGEATCLEAPFFLSMVRQETENILVSAVCNADQSRLTKEIHSPRSLALLGLKRVERVVQSVSATTHSFKEMPLLYADVNYLLSIRNLAGHFWPMEYLKRLILLFEPTLRT
ncbi:unnamed protein product [Heligmosomoides polygyrus]|uniref:HTH CENPB-type domain-containing protein n=1 Tax=Heligmosomoides polygyrus TaxID=6339 RepID=A0A183GS69_HELPZ|nr:unnamed protein product [Heligmosomoides polygyrus]